MGFLDKITKKVAETAKVTVTDSVKEDVKDATINAVPALIAVGTIIFGLIAFKSPNAAKKALSSPTAISTIKVVTNNYFFDDKTKAEVIAKLLNQKG